MCVFSISPRWTCIKQHSPLLSNGDVLLFAVQVLLLGHHGHPVLQYGLLVRLLVAWRWDVGLGWGGMGWVVVGVEEW